MIYHCCTDTRRNDVKQHPALNGIDFLEVLDDATDPFAERQTTLFIYFLKPLHLEDLDRTNFRIQGGERIKNIQVLEVLSQVDYVFPASPPEAAEEVLVLRVSEAGDFSQYKLQLVRDTDSNLPPEGFDPVLSSVDFSFKVACPTEFDCLPVSDCPPTPKTIPQINYLAKDYASFRKLMLDRMALLAPRWKERNAADVGITLVELLAYTGDYLSYRQDAIATEAYLGTARKRISVRRHARLVDYFMHDGCNARVWLHIQVGPGVVGLPLEKGEGTNKTKILSKVEKLPTAFRLDSKDFEEALKSGATVFELMEDIELYTEHNEMSFYTWGAKECCLPKGSTKATLAGDFSNLQIGDVLIFAEVKGPNTGLVQDADPAHRHAVRLTDVKVLEDIDFEASDSSPEISYIKITEISWDATDALPFPLCISGDEGLTDISIALGNIVLADHGMTLEDQQESSLLPYKVPITTLAYAKGAAQSHDKCEPISPKAIPARFNPKLIQKPLTFAAPFDSINITESATASMKWHPRDAKPDIVLLESGEEGDISGNPEWIPQRDLLNSAANAREFVVEVETDGIPYIRFGNGIQGARPAAETEFKARYRIGNGRNGNVGAKALVHIATNDPSIIANMSAEAAIWNPLPAHGGQEPETIEEVRQYAPQAFRIQERAVTSADYEAFAKLCSPEVQKAATTLRWTGSWNTIFLTVDRIGGLPVTPEFEEQLRNCLEQYRIAGFDLEVDAPLYVSLEIEMAVCVKPNFFRSDVKQVLLNLFSNQLLTNGKRGVFHPDNFSFGQSVYLSHIYAAAQAVQGVDSVQVNTFQRQGTPSNVALESGKLELGRREIARCDNDPNFPDHGLFTLSMQGGRA